MRFLPLTLAVLHAAFAITLFWLAIAQPELNALAPAYLLYTDFPISLSYGSLSKLVFVDHWEYVTRLIIDCTICTLVGSAWFYCVGLVVRRIIQARAHISRFLPAKYWPIALATVHALVAITLFALAATSARFLLLPARVLSYVDFPFSIALQKFIHELPALKGTAFILAAGGIFTFGGSLWFYCIGLLMRRVMQSEANRTDGVPTPKEF